jgi:hypothetical protein
MRRFKVVERASRAKVHKCRLPWVFVSSRFREGDVIECQGCERRYRRVYRYDRYEAHYEWEPVASPKAIHEP